LADVGLWWCGATPPLNRTEDLNVKGHEATTNCIICGGCYGIKSCATDR
jgi:hypothetical protein